MKKKGFTLIELLAVIVILAIIALITTPIIMTVIENVEKSAAERSADNYLRAVNNALAVAELEGVVSDGEYTVMSDGNLCSETVSDTTCSGTKIEVETNGKTPTSGIIFIDNGEVTIGSTVTIGEFKVVYNLNDKSVDEESDGETSEETDEEQSPRIELTDGHSLTDDYEFAIVDEEGTVWLENADVSNLYIMYRKGENRWLEIRFTEEGANKFKNAVSANEAGVLSITLDGDILVSGVLANEEIPEYAKITGDYETIMNWFNKLT